MKILLVIPSQYCGEGGVIDRSGVPFGRTPNMSVIQVAACTPPGHEVEVIEAPAPVRVGVKRAAGRHKNLNDLKHLPAE